MKRLAKTALVVTLSLSATLVLMLFRGCAVLMPGASFKGPLPVLEPAQPSTTDQLRSDVQALAGRIGERNVTHPDQLAAAEDFLAASLSKAGYRVQWQT